MKEQEIIEMLQGLGLKPQETQIYLACLQLGLSPVSPIAAKADIQRTASYKILDHLHREGVVSFVEKGGKKHYSAVTLEQLKHLQIEKIKRFEAVIPELKVLEKTVVPRPKVQFFEGPEGIKTALSDTLNQPKGSEFIAYFAGEGYYQQDPAFAERYVRERAKRGIRVRCLAPDTPATRAWSKHDKEQLRTTLLVPANKFPFSNEFDIYGNKVAIISLKDEFLAVIIESESIAKTQRMIFDLAWLGAKSLNKQHV